MDFDKFVYEAFANGETPESIARKVAVALNKVERENNSKEKRKAFIAAEKEDVRRELDGGNWSGEVAAKVLATVKELKAKDTQAKRKVKAKKGK